MHLSVSVIVSGFAMIFLLSQVVECKDGSTLMKYGKMITKRIGRYTKPLLMGTEEFTSKVTRDVGVASKFSVRNALNGLISTNKMLENLLRYAKNKIVKKKAPPADAAPAPDAAPEEAAPT